MNEKGFTLMETMMVVVILSILTVLAFPRFDTVIERTRSSEGVQILTALNQAQHRFALENDATYTNTLTDLDVTIPASNNFNAPTVANDGSANIVRTGGRYDIDLDIDGNLVCTPGDISDPICGKMGY